jgi:hypothetical protein
MTATTPDAWTGYTPEDLAWYAENFADTEWMVHVVGPDDCHTNEPDDQGEENPDGAPLTEETARALADSVRRFNAWYRAKHPSDSTPDLIPTVFHRGVPVETAGSAT